MPPEAGAHTGTAVSHLATLFLLQGGKGERGLPGSYGTKGEKGERVSAPSSPPTPHPGVLWPMGTPLPRINEPRPPPSHLLSSRRALTACAQTLVAPCR